MENIVVQRFVAASKAAEAAVLAVSTANAKATEAMENAQKLRAIADQANANLDYARNICNTYLQQMNVMSKKLQALREAGDVQALAEILPEATKLKSDFQNAHEVFQQAFKLAERANANFERAYVVACNLVTEAERLSGEAQKALDYAHELSKQAAAAC